MEQVQMFSERAAEVARCFGVSHHDAAPDLPGLAEKAAERLLPLCRPGSVVWMGGASGSGKSLLLRALRRRLRDALVANEIAIPDQRAIDCFPMLCLESALATLGNFGLGEVYTYLSPARRLSTGQQFRLRLAMGYARLLSSAQSCPALLVDEFATPLDAVTAMIVARNLRRVVENEKRVCAILASCREDVAKAISPAVTVCCDFGDYLVSGCQA